MSEPGDLSSWGAVLELFDSVGSEPLTAARVAEETGHPRESVEEELDELAERGVLRTKAVAGERVWWLPVHEHVQEGSVLRTALEDAPDRAEVETDRQRLLEQHRQLADLATRINVTDDLDEILALITEEARGLVGAHQSVCSRTVDQNWAQAINEVSLSEKYADYRDYDTRPDGSGIYSLVAKNNRSMRMTQAELESHPAWEAFGDEAEDHPPMRGWLAVPIVGSDGENKGLVQLSDKYRGEFTEADEAILVQLANVAAAAIENAQLYDELQASERRYRRLFESMTEGYCVVERAETAEEEPVDFRCVEANPAFEEHTGLDDVAERTIREVVLEDPEEWLDVLEEVLETGEVVTFEREFGSRGRVLQCQAFPVGDAPEGPVGLTVKDVTERVERERRLEESNERLEQFAHAASHDLQEPLRMVSSYLRLLENRYGARLDEDGEEFLEFAVDGAERMREMVESLLAYSRVDTQGEPFEEVDLDAVLEDARADLRVKLEESDADLTVEDLPTVEGDADQLRQLFQNLLENAVDYSGEDPPTVQVACERTGARWVVSVADEGVGIDPEHTDAVFQVFERLHSHEDQPGTGIGLALCERIVERHGGEMWVESEPGEGSTFYFTLPAVGGRRE